MKRYRSALHMKYVSERHLPYEITQCYLPLPPDTGERAPF